MAIAVAQYLRMSTEHQHYSLANQSADIQQYATRDGWFVSETYEDVGKSGLKLKNGPGLARLLHDVVNAPTFHANLVYDVSRWGRFQEVDLAAQYEFVCKSAGIPVLYCAENFGEEVTIAKKGDETSDGRGTGREILLRTVGFFFQVNLSGVDELDSGVNCTDLRHIQDEADAKYEKNISLATCNAVLPGRRVRERSRRVGGADLHRLKF